MLRGPVGEASVRCCAAVVAAMPGRMGGEGGGLLLLFVKVCIVGWAKNETKKKRETEREREMPFLSILTE